MKNVKIDESWRDNSNRVHSDLEWSKQRWQKVRKRDFSEEDYKSVQSDSENSLYSNESFSWANKVGGSNHENKWGQFVHTEGEAKSSVDRVSEQLGDTNISDRTNKYQNMVSSSGGMIR